MEWDEKTSEYVLASQRRLSANKGILGMSPRLSLTEGYDGYIEESPDEPFTPAERAEIASAMIEWWQKWARQE